MISREAFRKLEPKTAVQQEIFETIPLDQLSAMDLQLIMIGKWVGHRNVSAYQSQVFLQKGTRSECRGRRIFISSQIAPIRRTLCQMSQSSQLTAGLRV